MQIKGKGLGDNGDKRWMRLGSPPSTIQLKQVTVYVSVVPVIVGAFATGIEIF